MVFISFVWIKIPLYDTSCIKYVKSREKYIRIDEIIKQCTICRFDERLVQISDRATSTSTIDGKMNSLIS